MQLERTIRWQDYPSEIDGIVSPNAAILYGASNSKLGLVVEVTEWREHTCQKAFTVRLSAPVAVLAVDELTHAMATRNPAQNRVSSYIRRTLASELIAEAVEVVRSDWSLNHFFLPGLTTCIEVVADGFPEVMEHRDEVAANQWVQGQIDAF